MELFLQPLCLRPRFGSGALSPPRVEVETAAVQTAIRLMGLDVLDVEVISQGQTGIFKATTATGSRRLHKSAVDVSAARVTRASGPVTAARSQQLLSRAMHRRNAPVAPARHDAPITIGTLDVGLWHWLCELSRQPTAKEWGAVTSEFHHAGSILFEELPTSLPVYNPRRVFGPRIETAVNLCRKSWHPLFGKEEVVESFVIALQRALKVVDQMASSGPQTIIHGDNHPGNLMLNGHKVVFNDLERVAIGPPEVDLATLLVGIDHFGWSARDAELFMEGYGSSGVTLKRAVPFARVRELSGVIVAMCQAHESPEMENEMNQRLPAIERPGEGTWTWIGSPRFMTLSPEGIEDPDPQVTVRTPAFSASL